MAPIKFENNIKETLEKRTLKPSDNAWAKLSQKLDAEENSVQSKSYWWIGIAASIVLLVSVGILYINDSPSAESEPMLVENEKDQDGKGQYVKGVDSTGNRNNRLFDLDTEISVGVTNNQDNVKEFKKEELNPVKPNGDKKIVSVRDKIQIAEVEKVIEPSLIENFEAKKIREVVAQIQDIENTNASVSDREIDSLLKAAQREIITNRIYNQSTRTVDASALLNEIESDLDRSFRDKVFDALQNGYESVKTAVAERNQ